MGVIVLRETRGLQSPTLAYAISELELYDVPGLGSRFNVDNYTRDSINNRERHQGYLPVTQLEDRRSRAEMWRILKRAGLFAEISREV